MRFFLVLFNVVVFVNSAAYTWQKLGNTILGKHKDAGELFPVVDFSEPTVNLQIGGRVVDLANGEHFDDAMKDTPDELRPPGIVAFYGSSSCKAQYDDLGLVSAAEHVLPHRSRLFIGRYDMDAAPKRAWYKFTPERDLKTRFNITKCPQLVFFPSSCNGETKWCIEKEEAYGPGSRILGCENFVESCTGLQYWDGTGSYTDWVQKLVKQEPEPMVNSLWKEYKYQDKFLQSRDTMTQTTHFRNNFVAKAVPPFTPTGFKVVDIPPGLLKEVMDFYRKAVKHSRKIEDWELTDTQNSFHETIMHRISWDMHERRDELANEYLRPILEEWSGIKNLELTAFYGIREYTTDHFLRRHIDRTETHVISATLSIAKLPIPGTNQTEEDLDPNQWPLDVIDWNGDTVEYDHPPGKMVLYESAKLPHGRTRRNGFKGGMHVGLFCHFAPPKSYMDWDAVQKFAEQSPYAHADYTNYRNNRVQEPENPIMTEQEYGYGAHDDGVGYEKDPDFSGERQVKFTNYDKEPRTLYWSGEGEIMLQCEDVQPGDGCNIGTYPGHGFFWAPVDSKEPLQQESAKISIQADVHSYHLQPHDEL